MSAAEKLDALTAEFRAWCAANGYTAADGDAGDILAKLRERRTWLEAFAARWDAAAESPAAPAPRWMCPRCGDPGVQICLPAWHRETADGTLTYVETDSEADVSAWYCEECNDSDHGEPEECQ